MKRKLIVLQFFIVSLNLFSQASRFQPISLDEPNGIDNSRFSSEQVMRLNDGSGKYAAGDIPSVRFYNSTGTSLEVTCKIKGYKDRNYQIKGYLLDRNRKVINEISCPTTPINQHTDSVTFKINARKLEKSEKLALLSSFLQINVSSSFTGMSDVSDQSREDTFMFYCNRLWKKEVK